MLTQPSDPHRFSQKPANHIEETRKPRKCYKIYKTYIGALPAINSDYIATFTTISVLAMKTFQIRHDKATLSPSRDNVPQ